MTAALDELGEVEVEGGEPVDGGGTLCGQDLHQAWRVCMVTGPAEYGM